MSRQRKGGAGANVATQSLDALKVAKESIASTFDSLCEQDNNDGRFNSTIEAGLSATKRVMSAEIYQNLMKSVLERELQTWKLTRENAAFDRAEEAKERSSSSSSSSAAGSKRGRDDDDVDAKLGFNKDDTDKLVKRIREIAQAQLRKEEASVAKLKFYKDQAKKVDRGGNADADADADIQEVKSAPKEADFLCPFSKAIFETPMTNGKCPHHVDESSLKSMCRGGKTAKCPMVGCGQTWTEATATIDLDFKRRLVKFKKYGATQKEQQSEAIDLDDGYDNMA